MNYIGKKITDLDNLNGPVTLNFRGKDRFKTLRGGILTLAIYLCVLLLSLSLIERWLTRNDPVV